MKPSKCLKCASKASITYFNGLCRSHFKDQIDSRVKQEIRTRCAIKKDDIIIANEPIMRFFLKNSLGGMPIRLVKSEKEAKRFLGNASGQPDEMFQSNRPDPIQIKIALLWTLDDEIISLLSGFFGENIESASSKTSQSCIKNEINADIVIIKPLRSAKEDELIAFSKLVKIKFKKKKRSAREEEIKKAIESMEKKHPETKYSLLKSSEEEAFSSIMS